MAKLDENERELLNRIAEKIVQYNMTTPAIFMLEGTKPLSYIGSQVMLFFAPMISAFFNPTEIYRLSAIFEKREAVEELIRAIEAKDEEHYKQKLDEKLVNKENRNT